MSLSSLGTFFNYFLMYGIGFILGSYGGLFSESAGIIAGDSADVGQRNEPAGGSGGPGAGRRPAHP